MAVGAAVMDEFILDLFCGAGGAGAGYARAGLRVVGVDNRPQPRYPYEFIEADALEVLSDPVFMSRFRLAHASPPCQANTRGAAQAGTRNRHPRLIGSVRAALQAWGGRWVIENTMMAFPEMQGAVTLCGTMFGLGVFRHRLFQFSHHVPPVSHEPHQGRVGDGRYVTVAGKSGGSSTRDGVMFGSKSDWERAMGIDWMTTRELAQSIPPAYTYWAAGVLTG